MLLEALLEQHKSVLKSDLERVIEQIFVAVADANDLAPFNLVLRLSVQGEKAWGEVLTRKQTLLYDFDAGEEIKKLFDIQMQRIPAIAQKAVSKKMGNMSIQEQICKALDQGTILVRYDKHLEMQYYRQVDKKISLIDVDDFFDNISL